MYKIVVIDDEPMICRGLAEKMNWSDWDCEVVGTGTNGLEGKEIIDQTQPDIVITDIKMPGATGLELAHYVQNRYPETITIFLTGYNEFEFARTAIRENVFDYLIKPVDQNELCATMQKATAQLQLKRQRIEERQSIKNQLSEYASLAETGWLLDVILNRPTASDVDQGSARLFHPELQMGRLVIFEWENVARELPSESLHDIVTQTFHTNKCEIFPLVIEDRLAIVASYNSHVPRNIHECRVVEALRNVLLTIKMIYHIKIFAGLGDCFYSQDNLHASYICAVDDLKFRMFWDMDHDHEIQKGSPFNQPLPEKEISQLVEWVEQGNQDTAMQLLHHMFENIKQAKNIDMTRNVSLHIMFNLAKIAKLYESDEQHNSVKEIMECSNFAEIHHYIRARIQCLCQKIHENKRCGRENIVYKLTQDLQKNFHDREINLHQVAERFHISESHLSRLFKKELGINFNDYITQLRLEKAKLLLLEKHWLSNHDIAGQVGFSDGKYMGQVFKKYIGMTLSEYKGRRSNYTAHKEGDPS